jgi:hypothetical protein
MNEAPTPLMQTICAEKYMLQLDHFAMFSHNFYKSTFNVSKETGLGNYDGGFFPNLGIGIKVVPLGPDLFLEIEGVIDYGVLKNVIESELASASAPPAEGGMFKVFAKKPEFFSGWCFRTDTLEELEELARAAKWTVNHDFLNLTNAQQMMSGEKNVAIMAPLASDAWPFGMPNVYYWPDITKHDGRFPPIPETSRRVPTGLSWVEVGGTPKQFEDWFGGFTKASDHPLRFNGKPPGLYAIAVNTSDGEVVIRRPSLND